MAAEVLLTTWLWQAVEGLNPAANIHCSIICWLHTNCKWGLFFKKSEFSAKIHSNSSSNCTTDYTGNCTTDYTGNWTTGCTGNWTTGCTDNCTTGYAVKFALIVLHIWIFLWIYGCWISLHQLPPISCLPVSD